MFKNFTAAPHRVMFFGGALQALLVMLWWLFDLLSRYGIAGTAQEWPVSPSAIHAYLMIYGMFPFFMFGFLMTTFPRWMAGTEIPASRYVPAFAFLLLGVAVFYLGLFLGRTWLVLAAISSLIGWAIALYALLRVLLDTRPSDKRHTIALFIAFTLGWCGLAAYLAWLLTDAPMLLRASLQIGMWLFLMPVFISVGHRMIPFFTSSALQQPNVPRPFWTWWVMLAASALHGILVFLDAAQWTWLCDAPLAAAALYLSYLWGFRRSLKNPLLAVLHIGFVWMGIAMLMFTLQSLVALIRGEYIWALAPLHALTIGCFATLMIGMGTRVTLGHSGLPFTIGTSLKLMFAGMQLAAVLRVLADVLPMQTGYWLYIVAALLWLASFTPWVWRYLPAYWKPRADGQPG